MSDNDDVESILTTSEDFCVIPTISYDLPSKQISTLVKGYEDSGLPFVITGIPIDIAHGAPADTSLEWLDRLCQLHGMGLWRMLTNPLAHTSKTGTSTAQTERGEPMRTSQCPHAEHSFG